MEDSEHKIECISIAEKEMKIIAIGDAVIIIRKGIAPWMCSPDNEMYLHQIPH